MALEMEMEAAGISYELVRYGRNIQHGFTSFGGPAYDENVDMRSWEATERLILQHLKADPMYAAAKRDEDADDKVCPWKEEPKKTMDNMKMNDTNTTDTTPAGGAGGAGAGGAAADATSSANSVSVSMVALFMATIASLV
jgi:hypothetical protein